MKRSSVVLRKTYTFLKKLSRWVRGVYWTLIIRAMGGHVGSGLRVDRGLIFKTAPHKGIHFGNNISIGSNVIIDVPDGGCLVLGDRVKLNLSIVLAAQNKITIGNNSLIGEYSSIRDADHGIVLNGIPIQDQPMPAVPVTIGSDVWIARGVCVLKGCCIADGSVIGANAVVRSDIEKHTIAVGVPAKAISLRRET